MNTVTKRDLVVQISDQTGLTQHQVFDVIQLFIDNATAHLAQNESVVLRNFGTFEVLIRKSKIGRNPRQPEKPVRVPARAVVKFTPGKDLKEKVRQLLPPTETEIPSPAPKPAAAPKPAQASKVRQATTAVARKSAATGPASGGRARSSL